MKSQDSLKVYIELIEKINGDIKLIYDNIRDFRMQLTLRCIEKLGDDVFKIKLME